MHYLAKESIHFTYIKSDQELSWEIPKPGKIYEPQFHSSMDIFRAVQKNEYGREIGIGSPDGYPGVSKTTVQECLDEMAQDGWLKKSATTEEFPNKRLYRLNTRKLMIYLRYLTEAIEGAIQDGLKTGRLVLVTEPPVTR
jgi:hypothetical protein